MATTGLGPDRVEQLVEELSTVEKIGQLTQYFYLRPPQSGLAEAAVARGGAPRR